MDKSPLIFVAISIILVVGLALATGRQGGGTPSGGTAIRCLQDEGRLQIHIHPHLQILVDNKPVTVPANIGITPTCLKVIHTHDESGTIHIEDDHADARYTLSDFFAVWGQSLDSQHLLDHTADALHTLTMTVDGAPSTEFDHLVLKDKQAIVVRYETKP